LPFNHAGLTRVPIRIFVGRRFDLVGRWSAVAADRPLAAARPAAPSAAVRTKPRRVWFPWSRGWSVIAVGPPFSLGSRLDIIPVRVQNWVSMPDRPKHDRSDIESHFPPVDSRPDMPDPSKVFQIVRLASTLVVVPQGATMNFQYTDVHLESNELFRILDEPNIKNVLIDLGAVDYIDSIIISSLLRVLTKSRQLGGKGVFCCASDDVKEVLKCIQIGRLWPLFDTREEALGEVENEDPAE
jgi:anti-anti-sigma factor